MIAVVRPNAALIPKVHELLGAGDFAQRPGGQIAVSDSDYNILTMAISSADPLQSCAQAFVATDVNDLGSRAGAAMPAPAGRTCP